SYLEDVVTPAGLVGWIERTLTALEQLNRWPPTRLDQPSDCRTLRNAYRLVAKLSLTGMPLAPTGRLTHGDEVTALRNLYLHCLPLVTAVEPAGEGFTTAAAPRAPPPAVAETPGVPPPLLAAADLARILGQPVPRVETFLRRFRGRSRDCYEE